MDNGQVHVYSGNGKGKTTASMGLCVRAFGAGFKIYFGQFVKKGRFSDFAGLSSFGENLKLQQFGSGDFVTEDNFESEKKLALEGFDIARKEVLSGNYDLVVLDEIIFAVSAGLIDKEDVLKLMDEKPSHLELVLTGRGVCEEIIEAADLVSIVEEKKHYFTKGLMARKGIEI